MSDNQGQQDQELRDEQEQSAGEPEEVLDEQAIEQQIVPFMGDELAAALTPGGNIYITFPAMCNALGLNVRGQTQRVQRTRALTKALRRIPIETRGGVQRINCLGVDKVALWLAGVQTSQVKPEFRAKIEAYQDELAPVATQVFLRVAGIKATQLVPRLANPQIAEIAEQIDSLSDVVTLLREHLAALLSLPGQVEGLSLQLHQAIGMLESLAERQGVTETQLAQVDARTQRLTPAHVRAVQETVDRMVRETKQLPTPLTYAIIYGRLKHRFRVGSYKEADDSRFDEVMAYLREELSRATLGKAPEQGSLF